MPEYINKSHVRVRSLLVLLLVLMSSISFGFTPPPENEENEVGWIKKIVAGLDIGDYFLTTDRENNLLITGCFINKSMFSDKSLVSVGNYDIFLAKYNRKGTLLWLQQAGGRDFDMANNISVDTLGNTYITGYFTGACFFENYVVKSRAQRNAFTAKYNSGGKLLWVKAEGAEVFSESKTTKRKRTLSK